jgi:hypothetical protein
MISDSPTRPYEAHFSFLPGLFKFLRGSSVDFTPKIKETSAVAFDITPIRSVKRGKEVGTSGYELGGIMLKTY